MMPGDLLYQNLWINEYFFTKRQPSEEGENMMTTNILRPWLKRLWDRVNCCRFFLLIVPTLFVSIAQLLCSIAVEKLLLQQVFS